MKSDFHFHFYSRIFIMLILAVSLFLIQRSVSTKAAITYPYEVTGWAWNNTARWFSLNCNNDFEIPGVYESTCSDIPYRLRIAEGGDISGCMWAGNSIGGGTSPLGWICFNDVYSGDRSTPAGMGVATSSQYLNAIDPSTFASVLIFENWRCADGSMCNPNIGCAAGLCTFTDDEKWKVGFPTKGFLTPTEDDFPSAINPLQGCFNCYEEYTYTCNINGVLCDPSIGCDDDPGPPPVPQSCVVSSVENKCDNCLEYFYYPGRCETAGGTPSATMGCTDFVNSTADCCLGNNDCATGETCQNISSCMYDIEQLGNWHIEEYNCTPRADGSIPNQAVCNTIVNFGGSPCQPRPLGSYRKTIGGYDCSTCTIEDYDNRCYLNAEEANLNRCEACADLFYYPGVMIDNKHYNLGVDEMAYMCGWAWNGWDSDLASTTNPIEGLYWLQFSPRIVTSTRPYLSVESGNIYSQKGISGDYLPPFGHYNSSYLIESGGSISNFISSSTLSGLYQGEIPYQPIISFLKPDASFSKYNNALGSIDYKGLITKVDGNNNKYGSKVNENNISNITNSYGFISFSGDVIYIPNTLTIDDAATSLIIEATPPGNNGSGVIVIDGDAIIKRNIEYDVGTYSNLKEIPSAIWIVRGDLLISPGVSELAGTFIVLGDGDPADCSYVPPAIAPPSNVGCGQIVTCTGSDAECSLNHLTIRGSVIARYFNLNRTFVNTTNYQPSEQFINDGRLQINPPAGFKDFSNIIPRFSEN